MILGPGEKIIYLNEMFLELLKVDKQTLMENGMRSYLLPEYRTVCKQRVTAAFNGEVAELAEQKLRRPDGVIIDIEAKCSPFYMKDQVLVQVTFRDITDRKKRDRQIIQSEKLSMLGELSAGLAHEIRNPLTTIKGFLDLFAMENKGNSKYLPIMKKEIERIEEITSNLLDLSKPKEDNYLTENLQAIIENVIFLWETEAFKKGVTIQFVKLDEPVFISCQKNQITQVFINLIKNALEACSPKGTIDVIMVKHPNEVQIIVKDDGHGIPPEFIEKLGQSFHTTKSSGTGLGLMVTYTIIKNHDGNIEVESKEGNGTEFRITLPIV